MIILLVQSLNFSEINIRVKQRNTKGYELHLDDICISTEMICPKGAKVKLSSRPADISDARRVGELEYVDSFLHLVWLFCTPSMLRTKGGCVENLEGREG